MKKVILVVLALTFITGTVFGYSGWRFKECAAIGWETASDTQTPNVPGLKNPYAVTVDPDNNIWFGAYYQRYYYDTDGVTKIWPDDIDVLVPGGSSTGADTTIVKGTYPIFKLATDGTVTTYQFLTWEDGVTIDTTWNGLRGMCTDADGNIVVSTSGGLLWQLNYQTGEVIANYQSTGGAGHRPAADDNGYIYHGDLFGGNPVDVLDAFDFSVYTQVTATQPGAVARGLTCNGTGTHVWIAGNSGGNGIFDMYSASGPDGTYAIADTLIKSIMVDTTEMFPGVTCTTYEPSTGYLWFSTIQGDALEAFWAVDPATGGIVDSTSIFSFATGDTTSSGYSSPWIVRCPRDMAFSNDGSEMYIADFYGYTIKTWEYVDDLGVDSDQTEIPSSISLSQNYPNPFNPTTTIPFSMNQAGTVKLTVYDITGRQVETLINQHMNAGSYQPTFNAGHLASGVYFYELNIDGISEVRKMTLIK